MPVIEGLEQGTIDWLKHREGMVTASSIWKVMDKMKDPKKETKARAGYRADVVCEILTGRAVDHYVSPAMDRGTDLEPLARAAYEIAQDVEVEPGGFWVHDQISKLGASPDGIVGEDGLIEIKCRLAPGHLETLRAKVIPEEYEYQMTCQLACTGRQWVDYISWHPDFPPNLQLWVKRFHRDPALIEAMEREVCVFLEQVIAEIRELESA